MSYRTPGTPKEDGKPLSFKELSEYKEAMASKEAALALEKEREKEKKFNTLISSLDIEYVWMETFQEELIFTTSTRPLIHVGMYSLSERDREKARSFLAASKRPFSSFWEAVCNRIIEYGEGLGFQFESHTLEKSEDLDDDLDVIVFVLDLRSEKKKTKTEMLALPFYRKKMGSNEAVIITSIYRDKVLFDVYSHFEDDEDLDLPEYVIFFYDEQRKLVVVGDLDALDGSTEEMDLDTARKLRLFR